MVLGALSIVFFPILYLPFLTWRWVRQGKTFGFILKALYVIPTSGIHMAVFWMMGRAEAKRTTNWLLSRLTLATLYSSAYWLVLILTIVDVATVLTRQGQALF